MSRITTPLSTTSLKGLKILLIEDSSDLRMLYRFSLQRAGATVFAAQSAAGAWAILEYFTPDLIVCDIGLPQENGLSFIKKFRQQESADRKKIPALAITAFHDFYYEARRAGFDGWLEKPMSREQLTAEVGQLANR